MKQIILCADDFAYSPEISNSIITLAKQQRLSATSCLTNFPHWPTDAKKIQSLSNQISIGLHLNFTEGKALHPASQSQFDSIGQLIKRSFTKQVDKNLIQQEIIAQIEQFKKHFGQLPDFIDGHQHVHQLPVFRQALLTVYQGYYPNKEAMIRVSSNPLIPALLQARHCPKLLIITLTGALTLKKSLIQLNIPHNKSFSGIYDLQPSNYGKHFARFLNEVNDSGLIMCHPGNHSNSNADTIAKARQQEFDFLMSDEFTNLLTRHSIQLSPPSTYSPNL